MAFLSWIMPLAPAAAAVDGGSVRNASTEGSDDDNNSSRSSRSTASTGRAKAAVVTNSSTIFGKEVIDEGQVDEVLLDDTAGTVTVIR